MKSKWLRAETSADDKRIYLSCHLDTTKLDKNGNPDPDFVREFEWALDGSMTARRAVQEAERLIADERALLAKAGRKKLADEAREF